MATVVCQGLQSCLEPPIEPVTLRLRLAAASSSAPPPPPSSYSIFSSFPKPQLTKTINNISNENHQFSSNPEMGNKPNSWSFWEALSNNPKEASPIEKLQEKQTYVHPMVRRSSSVKLSEKSLQLCTENLGCETGSDIMTSDSNVVSSLSYAGKSPAREEEVRKTNYVKKTTSMSLSFPPPLTTIRENVFKVRSHREDGRLVVEAIKSPSTSSCLQAERSQGRLKLSIFKAKPDFETEGKQGFEENEEEKIENETRDVEGDFEDELDCYEREEDEESDEGNMMDGGGEDMEMEMEMFQRVNPFRCKDGNQHGNKRLLNWKPCWVATTS